MSRTFLLAAATLAGVTALATSAFAQASTIRIEPRPYYGATVTLEQGVRVWRTLPPTKYVIINPDHKTPLNLGLTDITERSTSHNTYTSDGGSFDGSPVIGAGGLVGPRGLLPSRPVGSQPNNRGNRHGVHGHRAGGLPPVGSAPAGGFGGRR